MMVLHMFSARRADPSMLLQCFAHLRFQEILGRFYHIVMVRVRCIYHFYCFLGVGKKSFRNWSDMQGEYVVGLSPASV